MYLITNKKAECSGCSACENIFPQKAIQMIEDEEGFRYPKINKQKCIKCRLCEKICPNIKRNLENNIIKVYGAKHRNEKEQYTSRSGGVFIALSNYILDLGGIIYGAKLNSDFSVTMERADSKEERDKFKGSKYVQADMNNVIKAVQDDLKIGRKVLFSGTPCQIAGVISCTSEKLRKNLYTCDIVCHGVPTKLVFYDYLKFIQRKYKKRIKEFNFRDKKFGWQSHIETITFEDDSSISKKYFRNLFYGHNIIRPSCFKCNYANIHRPADITIGDFWGIDQIAPEFLDTKGVSLVIINNEKGRVLFESIKSQLNIIECSIEDCIKHTYTLNQPTPKPITREEFWKDYKSKDFEKIIEKYGSSLELD